MNYWWLLAIIPYLALGILFLRFSGMGEGLNMIVYGRGKVQTFCIIYGSIVFWPLAVCYFIYAIFSDL